MAALNLPPPAQPTQPLVAYKHWNNKYVNWDCEVSEDEEFGTEEDSEATASE